MLQSHMPPKRRRTIWNRCAPRQKATGRFMILTGAFLQSVMRFFERHPFYLMLDGERRLQSHIRTAELPLCFTVAMDGGSCSRYRRRARKPSESLRRTDAMCFGRRADQAPAQRAGARMQAIVRERAYVYLPRGGGGGYAVPAASLAVDRRRGAALAGASGAADRISP